MTDELVAVEIFLVKTNGSDLVVVVAGVIEDAFLEVVTIGINSDFVFAVAEVVAAALLVDGMENVEELTDVAKLVAGGEGIKLGEGGFDEAGFGGEVAGQADCAHAAAVNREAKIGG